MIFNALFYITMYVINPNDSKKGVSMDKLNVDLSKVAFESGEMVEWEMTDSVSLLYDKGEKKYFIYAIDYDNSFDEFTVELDNDFDGMELDGVQITKKDFDEFKALVEKAA